MRRAGLTLPLALLAAGCSSEPGGTPLERGIWREETHFGTPKLDGLSIDALRGQLPPDTVKTSCQRPVIRSSERVVQLLSLKTDICALSEASTANGVIAGEGACAGLARKLTGTGFGKADSWIKISGNYDPRSITVDADLVITLTKDTGSTQRMTVSATHRAERIGDCP